MLGLGYWLVRGGFVAANETDGKEGRCNADPDEDSIVFHFVVFRERVATPRNPIFRLLTREPYQRPKLSDCGGRRAGCALAAGEDGRASVRGQSLLLT